MITIPNLQLNLFERRDLIELFWLVNRQRLV